MSTNIFEPIVVIEEVEMGGIFPIEAIFIKEEVFDTDEFIGVDEDDARAWQNDQKRSILGDIVTSSASGGLVNAEPKKKKALDSNKRGNNVKPNAAKATKRSQTAPLILIRS